MFILISNTAKYILDRIYTDKSIYEKPNRFTNEFREWNYVFHLYVRKDKLASLTAPNGIYMIGSIGSLYYCNYIVGNVRCLVIEHFIFPTFHFTSSMIPNVNISQSPRFSKKG